MQNPRKPVVKESSDELNPPVVVAEPIASKRDRSGLDYVALGIATCGVGYFPLAPGTWGSLLAVGLYFVTRILVYRNATTDISLVPFQTSFIALEFLFIALTVILGIWAAAKTERILATKDPGKVVIDEVAGQLIALLPVPLTRVGAWPYWIVPAFLLFRFFDIVKPYPARRLESLHGGIGIMADDLVAGTYAAIVLTILTLMI